MAPPTSGSLRAVAFLRRGASTAALLVGVLLARAALAQEPPPTRLEYRVPDACPAVAEFERRVQLRSARIRFLGSGTAPRTLYVDIRASGGASVGSLRLVESDGTDRSRGFQAKSCDDAVDGLALIAAVALDPEGASGLSPAPPPAPAPSVPLLPKPAAAMPTADVPPQPPTPKAGLRLRGGGLGAGVGIMSGVVPTAITGVNAFGQLDFEWWRWVAPSLRFSGTFFGEHRYDVSGGAAVFAVNVARLEICPLRLGSPHANVRPCVFGAAAIVESTGKNTQSAGTEVHPVWMMPGFSVLVSARIWGPIGVFGAAGAGLSFPRYEYAFRAHDPSQPNLAVSSTDWIAPFGGAGLTLDFP